MNLIINSHTFFIFQTSFVPWCPSGTVIKNECNEKLSLLTTFLITDDTQSMYKYGLY